MAVYFRHGSNGAYKSAYAVWFEILPALRAGRVVVTNIEGLKKLETIEQLLGEKFPVSARLIRIFSRKMQGIELWQNWFNWMPVNSLVVIDECQDIFAPEVGFKREKALKRPLEDFIEDLPPGFSDLFYERWTMADTSSLEEGDTDDVGETQLDEKGRLLYPDNYYGAFMRHRKYQWDIVLLTPDYTSIPKWMLGCATDAFSHTSTDTFFRKRRPRIYNHRPKSTKTAPSTKTDLAACSNKKIPIEVFALYKSTGTGGFNESKADVTILKSPKFILVILVGLLALGNFVRESYALYVGNNDDNVETPSQQVNTDLSSVQNGSGLALDENKNASQDSIRVASGRGSSQNSVEAVSDAVNPFYQHFPIFNQARAVYLTSVVKQRMDDGLTLTNYRFRIDKDEGEYYINSPVLVSHGYEFVQFDDCVIQVKLNDVVSMLTCPPLGEPKKTNDIGSFDRSQKLQEVDIFNLAKNNDQV